MVEQLKAGPQPNGPAGNGTKRTPQPLPLIDEFIGKIIVVPRQENHPECRYTIEGELSHGGMGTVYMAQDLRGVRVALKLTHSLTPGVDLGADEIAQRFIREAHALKSIDHPNVVKIHNCGKVADRLYIAMEYVDGTPLSSRLEAGHIPWNQAKNILAQACDGLAAAHNATPRKIVHRDIKPANIMLKMLGPNRLHITIIDFGAVKFPDSTTMQNITVSGSVIGTLFYASPEQVDGKEVDHRSDIYSLGAVMYEILTGKRPFDSPTVTTLLKQITTGTPVPPSICCPGTPKKLDRIVMKALERDPDKRYQTMEEFAKAIRKYKWDGRLPAESMRRPAPQAASSASDAETKTFFLPIHTLQEASIGSPDALGDQKMLYPGLEDGLPYKRHGRTRLVVIASVAALLVGAGALGISHFHSKRQPLTEPVRPAASAILQPVEPDSSIWDSLISEKKPAEPPVRKAHPAMRTVKKAVKAAPAKPKSPVQPKLPDTAKAPVVPKAPPAVKDTPQHKLFGIFSPNRRYYSPDHATKAKN